jgi:hypothetical protein
MRLKLLLPLLYILLSACDHSAATIPIEVTPPPTEAAFQKCYPKEQYRKPKSVLSAQSRNGSTYWQVDASPYIHDEKLGTIHSLFFQTNGSCRILGNSMTKPVSKLKLMPKDAAIALSKAHYALYFDKCFAKQSKAACVKAFYDSMEPGDESSGSVIIFPEDAIALKTFGVKVNATKGF